MKRVYQGKTVEFVIFPSGKDQSETGMYVEIEKQGWKKNLFIPDTSMARIISRELYYALVCEFFPNDFQTRPSTPEPGVVFRRIRKKSSSSRIRMTPQEAGVEAEPYDKGIIDSVEQSSQITDIGQARLKVEKTVFQSIQSQENGFDSADKMWWDIKFNITLLILCWKYGLVKISEQEREEIQTLGELFSLWKSRTESYEKELFFENDRTLTPLGQAITHSLDPLGIVYKILQTCNAHFWFQDEIITLQATNSIPDIDGHMLMSIDQSRILQIILVIILFGVLVAGVGSFITENRKIMKMLETIKKECGT